MPRHGTLRGVGLTALGAVVVAGSFVALGLRPDGIASYYRDTPTPAGFAIWFCGFVAATLAPPAIAVLCWFGAMRFRYGWLLPILLVPATYAAVRGSIALMLAVVSEPDSDGPTRWATDPAQMLVVVLPLVYFHNLGSDNVRRHLASTNDCRYGSCIWHIPLRADFRF